MRRHRIGYAAALLPAAVALAVSGVHADAASGNPATAVLQGSWVLTVTVHSYTGSVTTPEVNFPVGHTASVTVTFTQHCTAPGQCTVTFVPPGQQFGGYDAATGMVFSAQPAPLVDGVMPAQGFTEGYGGPGFNCGPPPSAQFEVALQIVQAVIGPGGADDAVTVDGTERDLQQWCTAGGGRLPQAEYQLLSIVGHPVGYVTPAPTAAPVAVHPIPAAPAAAAGTLTHPLPSTITASLATPSDAFGSLRSSLINAAITVGVLLFVTFPAQLFNRTFDENYEEIRDIAERRAPWLKRWRARQAETQHQERRRTIVLLLT
ncbi:MAG: hypothetical protein JOY68_05510, partial [Candidatus Dormibacteraeota bacterium]|nr:hypothetical protein [Candidatus Dormibacteraeota bacterium]